MVNRALLKMLGLAGLVLGSGISFVSGDEAPIISLEEFKAESSEALNRVEEFRFIKEQATKLGVRVYLFGGSSASFGNYLRWHLLNRKGDARYQAERFDFDFLSIFRGNQDLDLVVDGTKEQAEELERLIAEKYPYFKGEQSTWEVRLLKEDRGDKERLIGSKDFLIQDSDTASTALWEITDPPEQAERIIDLRDLGHKENPAFVQDLLAGKIQLYSSERHKETRRFKEGKNPKIIEAIRYLTKVSQFGYETDPADLEKIRETVAAFDPKSLREEDYVFQWIQKNGVKLYENSSNVLKTKELMDAVGLLAKLKELKGNIDEVGSLAWWMNKKPLELKAVGGGDPTAQTAEQLGLDYITHDTQDLKAWECMTRSPIGELNAFTSRVKAAGESAFHGEGLYCMPGLVGALRNGLPVQLRLKPEARLGWDFELSDPEHPETSIIRVLNKAAVTLVPTEYTEPIEYFKMLASKHITLNELSIPVRKRAHKKFTQLTESQKVEIDKLVLDSLSTNDAPMGLVLLWAFFRKDRLSMLSARDLLRIQNLLGANFISDVEDYMPMRASAEKKLSSDAELRKKVAQDLIAYYNQGGYTTRTLYAWIWASWQSKKPRSLIKRLFSWLSIRFFWNRNDPVAKDLAEIASAFVNRNFLGASKRDAKLIAKRLRKELWSRGSIRKVVAFSMGDFQIMTLLAKKRWAKKEWGEVVWKRNEGLFFRAIYQQGLLPRLKKTNDELAAAFVDYSINHGEEFQPRLLLPWVNDSRIQGWARALMNNRIYADKLLNAMFIPGGSYNGFEFVETLPPKLKESFITALSEKHPHFGYYFLNTLVSTEFLRDSAYIGQWMNRALQTIDRGSRLSEDPEADFKTTIQNMSYLQDSEDSEDSDSAFLKKWRPALERRAAELNWDCKEALQSLGD